MAAVNGRAARYWMICLKTGVRKVGWTVRAVDLRETGRGLASTQQPLSPGFSIVESTDPVRPSPDDSYLGLAAVSPDRQRLRYNRRGLFSGV